MRVLFDNVLLDYDTISGDNESNNYPASNLVHRILTKRYQFSYGASDQVTIDLTDSEYINCLFWSFTNGTQIDFKLYDAYDVLLASHSFTDVSNDSGSYYFSQAYFVKKITIDIYAVAGAYLGGVGAGEYYDLGSPVSPWDEEKIDNSIVGISPSGQTSQNYVEPLDNDAWLFRDWTRAQINELVNIYKAYGTGHIIWVDPFEDNDSFRYPYYAIIGGAVVPQKNGRRYDFEFRTPEAR